MDDSFNSDAQVAPSPWFVLFQFLGIYSNGLLAIIGIAVIVDRIVPGRTLAAELTVGAAAVVWLMLMRKVGAIPKPRRPRNGARSVIFVIYFLSFASVSPLTDWWTRTSPNHLADSIFGTTFTALLFAGFMSLNEKGVWLEPAGGPSANQTPPRTV